MARVRMNRGDPRRGAGPFAGLVGGDVTVETPNSNIYATGTEDLLGSIFNATIEDQTSGQPRVKGGRSGTGKKTSVV